MGHGSVPSDPGGEEAPHETSQRPAEKHHQERADRSARHQGPDRLPVRHALGRLPQIGIQDTTIQRLDQHHHRTGGDEAHDHCEDAPECLPHTAPSIISDSRDSDNVVTVRTFQSNLEAS